MIKMNENMKILLETGEKGECNLQIDTILNEVINKTKLLKDCIIYDEDDSLKEDKIDFSRILQFAGDKTGYEVSCNELIFGKQEITSNKYLELANKLCYLLSVKYGEKRFAVYISVYDDYVELRFHTCRNEEHSWLVDNLDEYDIPILYCENVKETV